MGNYFSIAEVTVDNSLPTSVSFDNIPQTYTDLYVSISAQGLAGTNALELSFNNSTANFSNGITLFGNGAGTVSSGSYNRYGGVYNGSSLGGPIFSNSDIYIPEYTSSNTKSYFIKGVGENTGSVVTTIFYSGLWSNSSAITKITIAPLSSNTLYQYSTFYLYGITNS